VGDKKGEIKMKTMCEFGSCKEKGTIETKMQNFATGEKRKAIVCRQHLKNILDSCCENRVFVAFEKLESIAPAVRPSLGTPSAAGSISDDGEALARVGNLREFFKINAEMFR
jgi:hypothetical protein